MLTVDLKDAWKACLDSIGGSGLVPDGDPSGARRDAVLDAFARIEQAAMVKACRSKGCTTSRTKSSSSRE